MHPQRKCTPLIHCSLATAETCGSGEKSRSVDADRLMIEREAVTKTSVQLQASIGGEEKIKL